MGIIYYNYKWLLKYDTEMEQIKKMYNKINTKLQRSNYSTTMRKIEIFRLAVRKQMERKGRKY